MNKYSLFWDANKEAGDVVGAVQSVFGRYGNFAIDNADVLLWLSKAERIRPAVAAITWCEETTFRFYSEPNKNTPRNFQDAFEMYDVGPFQLNVGMMHANFSNKYLSARDLDLSRVFGTQADIFDGDPIQNARAGCRLLLRAGQMAILATDSAGEGVEITRELYPRVFSEDWPKLPQEERDERCILAYTGPHARLRRREHWQQLGPLFTRFFELYRP